MTRPLPGDLDDLSTDPFDVARAAAALLADLPGFTTSAVPGHGGTLRSIRIAGSDRHVLVLGSRTHLYEGRGVRRVVHGVRTAAAAGARVVVLTNGCGGLDPSWAQ